jgi:hypothetical protein
MRRIAQGWTRYTFLASGLAFAFKECGKESISGMNPRQRA